MNKKTHILTLSSLTLAVVGVGVGADSLAAAPGSVSDQQDLLQVSSPLTEKDVDAAIWPDSVVPVIAFQEDGDHHHTHQDVDHGGFADEGFPAGLPMGHFDV